MREPTNPHDALFKAAFSDPRAAESQLRALLPEALLSEIDFGALSKLPGSYVDEELRQSHSDLLFRAPLLHSQEALLYLIYEHQSTEDWLMAYRILRYMVRVWDEWLSDQETTPRKLPPILPVVLHHGAKGWEAPRRFQELLDLPPAALPAAGRHFPEFEFVLDDLSERSDEDLQGRASPPLASLALGLFKHGRQEEDLLSVWRSLSPAVRGLKAQPDWTLGLQLAARYTYSVGDVAREDLARLVGEIAGADAEEAVMTTAERLRQEGKEEGSLQSRREILLRQLRLKFGRDLPAGVEQRVSTASLADLDAWLEQVVTANTLEQVFGE